MACQDSQYLHSLRQLDQDEYLRDKRFDARIEVVGLIGIGLLRPGSAAPDPGDRGPSWMSSIARGVGADIAAAVGLAFTIVAVHTVLLRLLPLGHGHGRGSRSAMTSAG